MEEIGLAAPQVTYVLNDLKAAGLNIDTTGITVEESAEEIMKALRATGKIR